MWNGAASYFALGTWLTSAAVACLGVTDSACFWVRCNNVAVPCALRVFIVVAEPCHKMVVLG